MPTATPARPKPGDERSLGADLLDEARERRDQLDHAPAARLSVEATVTVADTATASMLRQRQLAAIVRLLRHAVAVKLLQ